MQISQERFRCQCGKTHYTGCIGSHTECPSCGLRLWAWMWRQVYQGLTFQ